MRHRPLPRIPSVVPELTNGIDQLTDWFAGEGYSDFGWAGDQEGLSPAETAIKAMRELSEIRKTPFYNAWWYSKLVESGLVPGNSPTIIYS